MKRSVNLLWRSLVLLKLKYLAAGRERPDCLFGIMAGGQSDHLGAAETVPVQ